MPYPRAEPPEPTTDREGADELARTIEGIDTVADELSDINSEPAGYDFGDFRRMADAVLQDWRDAVEQAQDEARVIK